MKQMYQSSPKKQGDTDLVKIKKNKIEEGNQSIGQKDPTGSIRNDTVTKGGTEKVKGLDKADQTVPHEENLSTITKNEDEETKEVVTNFMIFIQQQMESMKKNIQILNDWSKYKDQSRQILRRLNLSPNKPNPFPHVISDNIIVDCKTEYDVIILVTSEAGHFGRRAWIRNTWAASQAWLTKKNWKVIFNVEAVIEDG